MKILIVVITADVLIPECQRAIEQSGHDHYVRIQEPQTLDENPVVNLYKNCSDNREKARQFVLAKSDADAFLFLDSDIVIPPGAIEEFIVQSATCKDIIGGWYRIKKDARYVAGKWIADNVFYNFTEPFPSLIETDLVGLGCAFITRNSLSELSFHHGCDLFSKAPNGQKMIVGECGKFGNDAAAKGYKLWMDGSVVCDHLSRGEATVRKGNLCQSSI